ncbi:MAG: glycosyltransferase [Acidobacteriota bacterium]
MAVLSSFDGLPDDAPSTTVLICTFNRSASLRQTLASLARMDGAGWPWDVLVVDNNSSDDTRDVVAALASGFPVPLRYLHEPRQGKSHALNSGIAASTAQVVLFTDDDVLVSPRWLEEAVAPLRAGADADYTGGPVEAIWGAPRPRWLPAGNSNMWGTIAALDYGPESFVFEERQRIPIGANMAVRRTVFDRVGAFDPRLGRVGKSLIGQEQAEFFYRTRRAGLRGLYVPEMKVAHHVPAARLTKAYFRRWWYWKGVARARLHRLHPETELGLDLRRVPRISGVPRFALGEVVAHARGVVAGLIRRDAERAAEEEMLLVYAVGYLRESRRKAAVEDQEGGPDVNRDPAQLAEDAAP